MPKNNKATPKLQPPVVAKRSAGKKQTEFPLAGDTMREQVLKAGKVTTKELGGLLRKGIMKTEECLEARAVQFFSNKAGEVVSERTRPHLDIQLRAAKQAIEVAGGFPTRFQDGGKDTGGVDIHIHLPWPGKQEDKKVIEAEGTVIPAEKGPRTS